MPWTGEPGRLQSMGLQESDTTEQVNNNKSIQGVCMCVLFGPWPPGPSHPKLLTPADSQRPWDKALARQAHLSPGFQKAHLGKCPSVPATCSRAGLCRLPARGSEGRHGSPPATTAALLLTSFQSPHFSPSPTFSMLY